MKHNFKEIIAWQKAKGIVKEVYVLANKLPVEEKYALASQIKRAVVSISSNIAEGSGRNADADFAHFLDMALGSAYELESELLVALELDFITFENCNNVFTKLMEVEKLIVGFQTKLRK